jgi:hypothetical protein
MVCAMEAAVCRSFDSNGKKQDKWQQTPVISEAEPRVSKLKLMN